MSETEAEIDTVNGQLVSMKGNFIIVMMPKAQMTRAEALTHAAWLVALADDWEAPAFPRILDAVQNT